jgi:hypothetical protein
MDINARRHTMFRAFTLIAAVAALVVSAAPALAERSNAPFTVDMAKKPPSPTFIINQPTSVSFKPNAGPSKARVGGKMHLEDISLGVKPKPKPLAEEMTEELHAIRR